ncbi:MAG: RHS repeat-associated core domain-containing protein [Bryobacterales bacterium]|nr:RHS repeat-associated core domain-containing protein [Bryobacterales bacterium]
MAKFTKVTRAVGHGTAEARTRFVYDDSGRTITTYRSKDTLTDDAIWSAISYDGLGRTTQTRKSDGQGTIYVDSQYDEFHRVKQQTSPYRSGDTAYWNYTTYDGLGRTKTQLAPGSATTSYTYTDNVTRITDPASVWRESTVDGAGRLIKVKEKTNDETTYTYNGLDNLLTVTQGAQTRTFSYDTAGLLAQVTNPESGTFTHFYDASGNVSQTNLPQGGSVTYTYDLIERRTFSDYSDANTPDVTLTWDTSSKMRLYRSRAHTGATTVAQTTFGSYDPLGRALTSSQDIIGAASAFSFTYSYDRAGNLRTMGYPSGRSLTITYTTGSLISALSGTKSSVTTNYLTSPSYTPFGALSQVSLANGLIERTDYLDGLPQVRQIRLGDSGNATLRGEWQFRYCNYGASPFFRAESCAGNNGNVLGQIHTISGASFNQTYNYDDVNRLCTVRETSSTTPLAPRACGDATGLSGDTWYQSYMFDRWGNMAVKATPGVTPHPLTVYLLSSYSTTNNRLIGSNWGYDAAGNMTTHGGWTLAYDSANRMKTSQPSGGSVTSYVYDADGRRVKKTTGTTSTYFVYDAFGQLAAEYSSTDPTGSAETHYLTTDHLGSTRLVTNQTGAVVSRHDYLPFGWELYSGLTGRINGQGYLTSPEGIATPTQRFTGKERDSETRLDYFGARYYSAGPGRFTSADAPFADQHASDPQSWNLYAYVRNRGLSFVDGNGREVVGSGANGEVQITITPNAWKFLQGAWDSTGGPLVSTIADPVGTLQGAGDALVNPGRTLGAIKDSLVSTARGLASGDPYSYGEVTGTVALTIATAGTAKGASAAAKEAQTARLLVKAEVARDALAAKVGASKATVTAGYNLKSRKVLAGACAAGKCAEDIVNEGLKGGADGFTKAVRPRTGKEVPVCSRCETTYGRDKFPPGTQFQSDTQ